MYLYEWRNALLTKNPILNNYFIDYLSSFFNYIFYNFDSEIFFFFPVITNKTNCRLMITIFLQNLRTNTLMSKIKVTTCFTVFFFCA